MYDAEYWFIRGTAFQKMEYRRCSQHARDNGHTKKMQNTLTNAEHFHFVSFRITTFAFQLNP